MLRANQIVAGYLKLLEERIKPGLSTMQLDEWAAKYSHEHRAVPAFKGYLGFPGNICVSINDQVVHGMPSKRVWIRKGDVVSVDFGIRYQGFYGDAAITIAVNPVSKSDKKLLLVARQSLEQGIKKVQIGNRVSDVSRAIQSHVEKNGFSVVRKFTGHGIGSSLHEGPEVPNFVEKKSSPRIVEGMVLAIEPMVNSGTSKVRVLKDGWTIVTADRKHSAHFEHSVAATTDGPLVLSRREGEVDYFIGGRE